MKTKLLLIVSLLTFSLGSKAQTYPLDISINLLPPYPSEISAYLEYLELGIVNINNTSSEDLEVFFEASIKNSSGTINVNSNGMLSESVTMLGNQMTILSPSDIQNIFANLSEADFITTGLSAKQRQDILISGQMPEGNYEICLIAYDANREPLSDPNGLSCTNFEVTFAERPFIISPYNEEVLDTFPVFNISWDIQVPNNIRNEIEYDLKIINLTQNSITNVQQAMLDNSILPEVEESGLIVTVTTLTDNELNLIPGNEYAVRVTAKDPENRLAFKYGGHSEVVTFFYGEQGSQNNGLAAPAISDPQNSDDWIKDQPLSITWEHDIDILLQDKLKYQLKIVDLTESKLDTLTTDEFINGNLTLIKERPLTDYIYELNSDDLAILTTDHKYGLVVQVTDPEEKLEFINEGYSEVIMTNFKNPIIKEPQENDCGSECAISIPKNLKSIKLKKNDVVMMGRFPMAIKTIKGDENSGYSGTGEIGINFLNGAKVQVNFENIKAGDKKINAFNIVFAGTATGLSDLDTELPKVVDKGIGLIDDLDPSTANKVRTAYLASNKLISALTKKAVRLPLGFDHQNEAHSVTIGIVEMTFSPTEANLTAMAGIENPEWGEYIPTLGATNICFHPNGFGDSFLLYLKDDFKIPLGYEDITLHGINSTESEKDTATYILVECKGFKEGAIKASIPIPQEVLLAENEDGTISEDVVQLKLSGKFQSTKSFMLEAEVDACQIPGLEGWSLALEEGSYDNSDLANPESIEFPLAYKKPKDENHWRGVYFKSATLKTPVDWMGASDGDRTEISINNFIKDKEGISTYINVNNILSLEKGNFENMAISVDSFQLHIIKNQFKKAELNGQLSLPIFKEGDALTYQGLIQKEKDTNNKDQEKNALLFTVKANEEGYDLPMLAAKLEFSEDTEILMKNNQKEKGILANISGKITVQSEYLAAKAGDSPDIDLPGIAFTGMKISTLKDKTKTSKTKKKSFIFTRPKFSLVGFDNPKEEPEKDDPEKKEEDDKDKTSNEPKEGKMNGFSLSLNPVKPLAFSLGDSGAEVEEMDISEGTKLKATIFPILHLVGGQKKKSSKKKENAGFAISAEGAFSITSIVNINRNTFALKYDSFSIDSFNIDAKVSAIEIKGQLRFEQNHEIYGNGIAGEIKFKIPLLEAKANIRFGSVDDYNYWYIDATLVNKKTPIATLYALSLHGFKGGAYYHMIRDDKITDGLPYRPNKDIAIGLKAGVLLAVGRKEICWGDLTLEAAFNSIESGGGIATLGLEGNAYFLKPEMEEPEDPEDIEGVQCNLTANMNFKDLSLDATLKISMNIADGLLIGAQEEQPAYQLVEANLIVNRHNWKMFMGSPSNPGKAQFKLPGITTTADAYLMISNGYALEDPILPPKIHSVLESNIEDFTGAISKTKNLRKPIVKEGLAMGANISRDLYIKASILYVDVWAMLGFDLSIAERPGVFCNQTGSALGMDGWYASGQLYAGMGGEIGLDIDIPIYTGKIKLASMQAALLLEGGMPNPIWIRGTAAMTYYVLGGIISGTTSFQVNIGDKCQEEIPNPLTGMDFIVDMDPAENEKVSVFAKPRVSFNYKIGEFQFPKSYDDPHGPQRKIEIQIEKFNLYAYPWYSPTSQKLVCSKSNLKLKEGDRVAILDTDEWLIPNSKHMAEIVIKAYEYIGKKKVELKNRDGSLWKEYRTEYFVTGPRPDVITMNNVALTYPFIDEEFYLPGNNYSKEGLIQLTSATDKLFVTDSNFYKEWGSKVVSQIYDSSNNLINQSDLKIKKGKILVFNMPYNLALNSKHTIKVTRIPTYNKSYTDKGQKLQNKKFGLSSDNSFTVEQEGRIYSKVLSSGPPPKELFSYQFKTSKYPSFSKKVYDKELRSTDYWDNFRWAPVFTIWNGERLLDKGFGYRNIPESKSRSHPVISFKEDYKQRQLKKIIDLRYDTRDNLKNYISQVGMDKYWINLIDKHENFTDADKMFTYGKVMYNDPRQYYDKFNTTVVWHANDIKTTQSAFVSMSTKYAQDKHEILNRFYKVYIDHSPIKKDKPEVYKKMVQAIKMTAEYHNSLQATYEEYEFDLLYTVPYYKNGSLSNHRFVYHLNFKK